MLSLVETFEGSTEAFFAGRRFLNDKLNELEKSYIKREIRKMIEGELFMLELESDY